MAISASHTRSIRRRTAGLGLTAVLVLAGTASACSSDSSSDATATTAEKTTTTTTSPGTLVTVSDVFAPPAAAGADASVYLSLTGGATADQLVGVSVASDWADSAALVPDTPIELPATTTVVLSADGPYIELVGLKKALEVNKPFEITLKFADAPDQTVQGDVRSANLGSS